MKPVRIQLSRKKGWKMPPNTMKVDRTTKWGNPFIIGKHGTRDQCVELLTQVLAGFVCISLDNYKEQIAYREMLKRDRAELKGKNLACWCPPGAACHADILLRIKQA